MYIEELRKDYQAKYSAQKELANSAIDELKKYIHSNLVCDNYDFVTIYVCKGGGTSCGFPNISTDEKYTIHSMYRESLLRWLKENGFKYTLTQLKLGDKEWPPAHGGWIAQSNITKIVVSSEGIKQ